MNNLDTETVSVSEPRSSMDANRGENGAHDWQSRRSTLLAHVFLFDVSDDKMKFFFLPHNLFSLLFCEDSATHVA